MLTFKLLELSLPILTIFTVARVSQYTRRQDVSIQDTHKEYATRFTGTLVNQSMSTSSCHNVPELFPTVELKLKILSS